jgi:hypothetical protein
LSISFQQTATDRNHPEATAVTDRWCYIVGGRVQGPVLLADLQKLVASGELSPTDLVWPAGSDDSQPVQAVPELSGLATAGRRAERTPVPPAADLPKPVSAPTAPRPGAPAAVDAKQQPDLPRPLSDPLRVFRTVLGLLILAEVAGLLLACGVLSRLRVGDAEELFWGMFIATAVMVLPFTLSFWRVLPGRPANALYLRSFRNDRSSWPLRAAAQRALGRKFRLSGIRDPRRRWPPVLRYFHSFLFALHYNTPKFMNLEAGDDWKARLWRSLGDARCALIDLTDLTPYVAEEVHLCYQTLGLKRLLFVIDSSRSIAEWRDSIARMLWLPAAEADRVQTATWDNSPEGRREFAAAVRSFAASVPAGSAGLKTETLPLAYSSELPTAPTGFWDRHTWVEILLGMFLGYLLITGYQVVATLSRLGGPLLPLVLYLPLLALGVIEFVTLVRYVIDCGSNLERVLTVATFGASGAWLVLCIAGLVLAIGKVREAAERAVVANNLKQIGYAMQDYESATDRLPPHAIYSADRRPLLSWRVALLPYLEQGPLYSQFRLDEPWDSEHNKPLLPLMPRVFARPGAGPGEEYKTRFQAFVSRPSARVTEMTAFPAGPFGSSLRRMTDGTSNTILVVEAADAVEWTRPQDLPFLPADAAAGDLAAPLPGLGVNGRTGFQAVLGDGSVRWFPGRVDPARFRALLTPNGGEPVTTDDLDR